MLVRLQSTKLHLHPLYGWVMDAGVSASERNRAYALVARALYEKPMNSAATKVVFLAAIRYVTK